MCRLGAQSASHDRRWLLRCFDRFGIEGVLPHPPKLIGWLSPNWQPEQAGLQYVMIFNDFAGRALSDGNDCEPQRIPMQYLQAARK
jgi:hypothetical protein